MLGTAQLQLVFLLPKVANSSIHREKIKHRGGTDKEIKSQFSNSLGITYIPLDPESQTQALQLVRTQISILKFSFNPKSQILQYKGK